MLNHNRNQILAGKRQTSAYKTSVLDNHTKNIKSPSDRVLDVLKTILLFYSVVLVGCGDLNKDTPKTKIIHTPCTVTEIENGSQIDCPDGTSTIIKNGEDGSNGNDGLNGTDGVNGKDGVDGKDGKSYKGQLVYRGYYCGRTVVSLNKEYFVINSGLVKLTKSWYKIGTCEIRYYNKDIQVK